MLVLPCLLEQLPVGAEGEAILALAVLRQGQLRTLVVIVEARLLVRGDAAHRRTHKAWLVLVGDFLFAGGDCLAYLGLATLILKRLQARADFQGLAAFQAIVRLVADTDSHPIGDNLHVNRQFTATVGRVSAVNFSVVGQGCGLYPGKQIELKTRGLAHLVDLLNAVAQAVIQILPGADDFILCVQCFNLVFFAEHVECRAAFATDVEGRDGAFSPAAQGLCAWIDFGDLCHAIGPDNFELLPPGVVFVLAGQGLVGRAFPVDDSIADQLAAIVVSRFIGVAKRQRITSQGIGVPTLYPDDPIVPIEPGDGFDALDVLGGLPGLLSAPTVGQRVGVGTAGSVVIRVGRHHLLDHATYRVIDVGDHGVVVVMVEQLVAVEQ
ncbi:hypothetical protein D3C76_882510 [compost metagenome]